GKIREAAHAPLQLLGIAHTVEDLHVLLMVVGIRRHHIPQSGAVFLSLTVPQAMSCPDLAAPRPDAVSAILVVMLRSDDRAANIPKGTSRCGSSGHADPGGVGKMSVSLAAQSNTPQGDTTLDDTTIVMPNLAIWQQATADIIAHLDAPSLPAILDRSLETLVQFDQTVIFAYPDQAQPLYLHDGFRGHAPGAALDNYIKGAYLLDPFYTACVQRISPGLYRISELAPDHFFEGE